MATPFRASCKLTPPSGKGEPVNVEAVFADFCTREYEPGQTYCCAGEPVWADPPLADGPIKNNVRGKVAIIARGEVDFLTKAQHAVNAGAVGVIFENTEDSLSPQPSAQNSSETVQIPCILIPKSALRSKELAVSAGYGRAVPTHSNPDGPSFCIITPATVGPAGCVDFQSLIDGLPGAFEDKDFPPDSSSLYVDPRAQPPASMQNLAGKRIEWKRPEEICKSGDPQLFLDGTDPGDLMQGQIGDCYLLSSASILASSQSSHLLHKLFVKSQYFKLGLVGLRFFKDGRWWDVAIDTLIPCSAGSPVFCRMSDSREFWMMMLEKAYAKIHGCYEALDGGHMNECLADLTGGAPGRVKVLDLFRLASTSGSVDKAKAMGLLSSRAQGELLQGASSSAGGTEEAVGNGIYSGHAYSINDYKSVSLGGRPEVLVRLRNPWGQAEWTGKWSDKDPLWQQYPEVANTCGHKDEDDGFYFIGIEDFLRTFTEITYVDLVPDNFCKLRAEGAWTTKTGGGCCNHNTWRNNPQILMRVTAPCSVHIALDQEDNRCKCKAMGKAAWDALSDKGGFDHYIGFSVLKGSAKKRFMAERDVVTEAPYINTRSVSRFLDNCPAGDYIIVPTTFDPTAGIKFVMRFFASASVELIDCDGGDNVEVFDAAEDQISKQAVPISLASGPGVASQKIAYEEASVEEEATVDRNRIKKHDRSEGAEAFSGILSSLGSSIKKTNWKVGERIPAEWEQDTDFAFRADHTFDINEIVIMYRSDKSMRFGKIVEDNGGLYTIDVTYTTTGPLQKQGVPATYIGKLPGKHGVPQALVDQIGSVFDTLDMDGSGYLEVSWDSQELSGDLAKRLLLEMQIPQNSMSDLYLAMRRLDANGDGKIDRDEFVSWFAKRSLELA